MLHVRSTKMRGLLIACAVTLAMLPFQNCSKSGFNSTDQSSILGSLGGSQPTSATMRNVKVAWDKSTSTGVTGYRVYVGKSSGNYDQNFDAGLTANPDAPQFEIPNLDKQTTYYVVVRAYDQSSESASSNELPLPAQ
ncbi:MAG: fibronectin type III domain-containing protein [Pseudobdellovibrionaceae bacterium]